MGYKQIDKNTVVTGMRKLLCAYHEEKSLYYGHKHLFRHNSQISPKQCVEFVCKKSGCIVINHILNRNPKCPCPTSNF